MFPEVDPVLGPEMRSTGEVLGMADTFGLAFYKAQEAAGQRLPLEGTVLITVSDKDKRQAVDVARGFRDLGFTIRATAGTCALLQAEGIEATPIAKRHEGRPNILDAIANREIQLVDQHPLGQGRLAGRLLHPQGGHQVEGDLHHHHRRRPGRGQGDRGPAPGSAGRPLGPELPRRHPMTAGIGIARRAGTAAADP